MLLLDKIHSVNIPFEFVENFNYSYQEFYVYGDDMPGFNEMLSASKTVVNKKGTRIGTSYGAMKLKWNNKIQKAIEKQNIHSVDKIFLHMIWLEKNKRRDPDNIAAFLKFILDGLQKSKIIKNDNWKYILGWRNDFKISDKRGVKVGIYGEIN